jgi:RNA polymerase sigma factor (sigma-70 family)
MPETICVVDADQDVRRSVCWLLTGTGREVRPYATPRECLEAYDPELSGCLLFDLEMSQMNGLELRQHVAARGGEQPVIFMSSSGSVSAAVDALHQGACDFLEKPFKGPRLIESIERACAMDKRNREQRASRDALAGRLARLTPREREVLDMVLEGRNTREIAQRMKISEKTVHVHRSNIAGKMHVETVAQVVRVVLKSQASGPISGQAVGSN